MSGEQPGYRQKQEKAAQERKEAQEQADREQIIAALQRVAQQQEASDKETKRGDRFHRLAEKLTLRLESRKYWVDVGGVIGIFIAAGVAIWAVLDAHSSSDKQYQALRDQQRAMQGQLNQMRIEQRPWVIIASVETNGVKFGHAKDGIFVSFDTNVTLKNTGNIPAMHVVMHSDAYEGAYMIRYGQRVGPLGNASCGFTSRGDAVVFPNSTELFQSTYQYPTEVFAGLMPGPFKLPSGGYISSPEARTRDMMIMVFGCLTYNTAGESVQHHTRFEIDIGHKTARGCDSFIELDKAQPLDFRKEDLCAGATITEAD